MTSAHHRSPSVTELLQRWSEGDKEARDQVIPLVYEDLHRIAAGYARKERRDHTLQPTALVHEAYLRLCHDKEVAWQGRIHFLGIAAAVMRRILVDYSREKNALKRGGGAQQVPLVEILDLPALDAEALLALDEALQRLAALDPQQAQVVELRYFGGLSLTETAEALRVSRSTVIRQWRCARAWLHRALSTAEGSDGS